MEYIKENCSLIHALYDIDVVIIDSSNQFKCKCLSSAIPKFLYMIIKSDYSIVKNKISSTLSIILHTNQYMFHYIGLPILSDNTQYFCIVGPYLFGQISRDIIENLCKAMGFDDSKHFALLRHYLRTLPLINHSKRHHIAIAINNLLRPLTHVQIETTTSDENKKESYINLDETFNSLSFAVTNHEIEEKIMECITQGDSKKFINMTDKIREQFYLPDRFPENSILSLKHMILAFNTIACRAAIKGGLPISLAHSASYMYGTRIERAMSFKKLLSLQSRIGLEYCQLVSDYTYLEYNPLVKRTIDYIYANLHNIVKPSVIAKIENTNQSYLSKIFKEQTGKTIMNFVHTAKINKAIELMNERRFTLTDISHILSYNSQSHFSRTFKQITSLSPKDYMKSNLTY